MPRDTVNPPSPEAERAIAVLVDTARLSFPDRDWEPWARAVIDSVVEQARAEGRQQTVREILRETGVVHEAEPPGIDYVTVQIDMDTWADMQRVAGLDASASAPATADFSLVGHVPDDELERFGAVMDGDTSESGQPPEARE